MLRIGVSLTASCPSRPRVLIKAGAIRFSLTHYTKNLKLSSKHFPIGIPLYSNAAGTIPIVQALVGKGLPMGTALAFMMSIVAISTPEMIILRKVIKPKLIAIFAGVVAGGNCYRRIPV